MASLTDLVMTLTDSLNMLFCFAAQFTAQSTQFKFFYIHEQMIQEMNHLRNQMNHTIILSILYLHSCLY